MREHHRCTFLTAFTIAFVVRELRRCVLLSLRELYRRILLTAFAIAIVLQPSAREFRQHILLTTFVSQSSVHSLVRATVVSTLQLLALEHWESHTSDSSTNCHLLEAILQRDFCFIPELRSSSFSVLRIRALAVSSWTLRCCLPLRFCATAFIFTWQPRCALNTRLKFQCPHADTWLPCGLEF